MENNEQISAYEVLGQRIKMKSNYVGPVNAKQVIELIDKEARAIRSLSPSANDQQVSVLVALKLAEEILSSGREYKENIDKLQVVAKDALQFIEEVSPTVG